MIGPHLLDISYWIASRPGAITTKGLAALIMLWGLLLAGMIIHKLFIRSKRKKLTSGRKDLHARIDGLLITIILLGALWTLFAYQGLPILATRAWLLLIIIAAGIWAWTLWRHANTTLKSEEEEMRKKQEMRKYLPKGMR